MKIYLYKCIRKDGTAIMGFKTKDEAENALKMLKPGFKAVSYIVDEIEEKYL